MRIAYLDTFSGISGDMALGAFLDAGMPIGTLRSGLEALVRHGWSIRTRTLQCNMISATRVELTVEEDDAGGHGRHSHRSYSDVVRLLESSSLSQAVRDRAVAIYECIGRAEARIHGIPLEHVRFHEVGDLDSILDVAGTALCMDYFGIERVYSSPIRTGSGGMIRTHHGDMPVPTPATLEILKGYPIEPTSVPFELATPTGAGIVAALSTGLLPQDAVITVERIGYGAGGRDIPGMPNLLRVVIGELQIRTLQQCI